MQNFARSTAPLGVMCRRTFGLQAATAPRTSFRLASAAGKGQFSATAGDGPSVPVNDSEDRPSSAQLAGDAGGHDDFWSTVKSAAEMTPAYSDAAGIGSHPSRGSWGPPNDESRSPVGEAYGADSGEQMPYSRPPPMQLFDMTHPTHLSPVRRVSVKTYRGRVLVDIRQFYKDETGVVRPASKGISLTVAQYAHLKACMERIDQSIRENGEDPDSTEAPPFAPGMY